MDEKLKIARSYIIPEVLEDHGITDEHMEISDEGIRFLIESYTREAGVRTLKRVGQCRPLGAKVASDSWTEKVMIDEAVVEEIRGPVKYSLMSPNEPRFLALPSAWPGRLRVGTFCSLKPRK